jgi:hypothetical protein
MTTCTKHVIKFTDFHEMFSSFPREYNEMRTVNIANNQHYLRPTFVISKEQSSYLVTIILMSPAYFVFGYRNKRNLPPYTRLSPVIMPLVLPHSCCLAHGKHRVKQRYNTSILKIACFYVSEQMLSANEMSWCWQEWMERSLIFGINWRHENHRCSLDMRHSRHDSRDTSLEINSKYVTRYTTLDISHSRYVTRYKSLEIVTRYTFLDIRHSI